MIAAIFVAWAVRRAAPLEAPDTETPKNKRIAISVAAFAGSALGARLPLFLASRVGGESAGLLFGDGKTVIAGMAFGYVAVELTKLALGVRAKTGDSYALPAACAMAVGRFGCFFNGCCAGTRTTLPWGYDFGDRVLRHPAQLYEVLFHSLMAVFLWRTRDVASLKWQRLKLYFMAYGVFRFCVEFVRYEPRALWGLSVYQLAVVPLVALLGVQWIADERRKQSVLPTLAT